MRIKTDTIRHKPFFQIVDYKIQSTGIDAVVYIVDRDHRFIFIVQGTSQQGLMDAFDTPVARYGFVKNALLKHDVPAMDHGTITVPMHLKEVAF